ncbi:hypothetical protein NPX79_00670 [Spiroplasma endosymbiont of Anurida maritima]|uniref:hypothetical protein n=1 Tax=Spiroplasma endosymbiont of Anurida maritima TaxID=2967972 RepID=UPI0036D3007D
MSVNDITYLSMFIAGTLIAVICLAVWFVQKHKREKSKSLEHLDRKGFLDGVKKDYFLMLSILFFVIGVVGLIQFL